MLSIGHIYIVVTDSIDIASLVKVHILNGVL